MKIQNPPPPNLAKLQKYQRGGASSRWYKFMILNDAMMWTTNAPIKLLVTYKWKIAGLPVRGRLPNDFPECCGVKRQLIQYVTGSNRTLIKIKKISVETIDKTPCHFSSMYLLFLWQTIVWQRVKGSFSPIQRTCKITFFTKLSLMSSYCAIIIIYTCTLKNSFANKYLKKWIESQIILKKTHLVPLGQSIELLSVLLFSWNDADWNQS